MVCPLRVKSSLPVPKSHSLMVLSKLPVASTLPSGLKATEKTRPVWPLKAPGGDCASAVVLAKMMATIAKRFIVNPQLVALSSGRPFSPEPTATVMVIPLRRRWLRARPSNGIFRRGREAAPHGVFCNSPRQDKLQQIIRPARLGADAGQLEAAERLAVNQGAGDLPINIQISDAKLTANLANIGRAAGIQAAGQRVLGAIGRRKGLIQVAHLDNR